MVTIRVIGPRGSREVKAMIDTGATFTKIPASTAAELGLDLKYEAEVELADGRLVQRKLGLAEVEVNGVTRPVLVAASPDGERTVVGYTTLEHLGFKVNPTTRQVEKTRPIEY